MKNYRNMDKETYLQFIDWLELKVVGTPDTARLQLLGYNPSGDHGAGMYRNIFENDYIVLFWNNRSPYLVETYTHIRVKNEYLYKYTDFQELETDLMKICRYIFPWTWSKLRVSRIDFCFDFVYGGEIYNHIKNLFTGKTIKQISQYTSYYTKQANGKGFYNYSAGSRTSLNYYRMYNKTFENRDKKNYINKIHRETFGENDIYRYEIEYKPEKLEIFKGFLVELQSAYNHYFNGFNLKRLHSTYDRKISILTIRDIKDFQRILSKIEAFDGCNFSDIRNYTDAIIKYIK